MQGMNRKTGKALSGIEHLNQSIFIILNTPIGSRPMLPEFGSKLPELIDTPLNDSGKLQIYAETIEAVKKWEPRITVAQVKTEALEDTGQISITLSGTYDAQNIEITTTVG